VKILKKILFSLIVLFSVHSNADMNSIKDSYMEILGIIKLYCKPGQYFNPKEKKLIRANLDNPVIGICETDQESFYNIYIDSGYWMQVSKDMQFELMAHEMSHCLFFRNHVDNDKNFMYPVIRDLTKEQTTQQLIENLNQDCGDGHGK